MMFSLDFHEVSLTHKLYIGLYKQAQYQALYDINKGHGIRRPPYLLGDKRYSFMNWKMDTTELRSCCIIEKTQMGPLCRKKCFWNSKNNFQGTIFQIKIECGFHT
jgi:hypothetical protein